MGWLDTIFNVIAGLVILGFLFVLLYSSISYLELRSFIKDCNRDFGVGNWTFNESWGKYSCISYTHTTLVSTLTITTTQDCFENGIRINCSEIGK
jgi:ABC-type phosphate transport system permease subunit